MGDDLQGRVPVDGMADCQLGKPEVPLRVRLKRRQEEENKRDWNMSLGSLWKEGERDRERERERKREAGEEGDVDLEVRGSTLLSLRIC